MYIIIVWPFPHGDLSFWKTSANTLFKTINTTDPVFLKIHKQIFMKQTP